MTRRDSLWYLGAIVTLAGCGGGDATVTPTVRVRWPALSRAVDPNSHGRSIQVRLRRKGVPAYDTAQEIEIRGDRLTGDAHVAEYRATKSVAAGIFQVTVSVHAGANATGRQLQTNTVEVTPGSDGLLPDIILQPGSGHVLTLALPILGPLTVGQEAQLIPAAQFVGGFPFIFAGVADQDVKWEIVSSEPAGDPVVRIDYNGTMLASYRVTALRAGVAQISVRIDDAVSAPISVSVTDAS
ncbi:MAG: hypothetical protein QM758_28515 [Armatimonas sp.]